MQAADVGRRPSPRAQFPGSRPSAQGTRLDAVCSSQGDGVRMLRGSVQDPGPGTGRGATTGLCLVGR